MRHSHHTQDSESVATYSKKTLPLASANLGEEYYYQSLPLCVIDSVYSIGVRYEGVRNVVARYCANFGLRRVRSPKVTLPPTQDQESISAFCEKADRIGLDAMAASVFRNRQRTSARNGILKADAVRRFAAVLKTHGVEYLQDIPKATASATFAKEILAIPGQGSGISLGYFFMLAGADDLIKPDRMILAFLQTTLGRPVSAYDAQEILSEASNILATSYPYLTPRLLDHEIWKYQRDR